MKKIISIEKYGYGDERLNELGKLVQKNSGIIEYCIVHGSFGNNEVVKFSDFDGLLILKSDSLYEKSKDELKRFIRDSYKIIYKIDPLQHHGWFVIKKNQLENYPQDYLPNEVFEFSKSLSGKDIEFEIEIPLKTDYLTPFVNLKNNLLRTIREKRPKNLYKLKSFLSGLMLMPSLYLQAKLERGCFKKDSFNIAKNDFSEREWKPIEVASSIRQMWNYELNYFQKIIMTSPGKFYRILAKRLFAPRIDGEIGKLLGNQFYSECRELLESMHRKLQYRNTSPGK
jgi:hypothetical protein